MQETSQAVQELFPTGLKVPKLHSKILGRKLSQAARAWFRSDRIDVTLQCAPIPGLPSMRTYFTPINTTRNKRPHTWYGGKVKCARGRRVTSFQKSWKQIESSSSSLSQAVTESMSPSNARRFQAYQACDRTLPPSTRQETNDRTLGRGQGQVCKRTSYYIIPKFLDKN